MLNGVKLRAIEQTTCFIRGTHKKMGRSISVTPESTASRYLHYGRIILVGGEKCTFTNETHETGFVCLNGSAKVAARGETFDLGRYDALYIPRDSAIDIMTASGCDLAEISAPVENQYPVQFVQFAEIRKDSSLSFIIGKPPIERDLNILFGKNLQAGRIMAGVTFSSPGNWTSFPPHEHAEILEEAYLYIDMPEPAFGIQLVYTDLEKPELVQIVKEGDVVVMPKGYHPNVAAPGGQINFLWMMAAHREGVDRQFGVVNVQPEFDSGKSGLESSRQD